jgi:hypothetical protein
MLGKVCQALADQEVNILAIESFPTRGKFVTRFIVDNPDTAKTVLNNEKLTYTEKDIVQIRRRVGPLCCEQATRQSLPSCLGFFTTATSLCRNREV